MTACFFLLLHPQEKKKVVRLKGPLLVLVAASLLLPTLIRFQRMSGKMLFPSIFPLLCFSVLCGYTASAKLLLMPIGPNKGCKNEALIVFARC